MYNFVDTTERYPGQNLPSEALMFNGNYLENVIPGYRTLYVSGREIINTELTELEVGALDGARYRRKRYPSRTIVVGYQLIAEDNGAFRNAYNKLNALLDEEQATLIFADEPDKFFIGTKQGSSEVPTGKNAIASELEFYCADPFKTGNNFLHDTSKTAGKLSVMDVYDGTQGLYLASSGYATTANKNGWNGAMKTIPIVDSNGTKGSANLYCYVNSWFETGLMGQTGCQAVAFCDTNGKMICCQEIYKNDMSGNTAAMCMWVGGNKPRVVKKYTFEPCYRDDSNPYNRLRGDSDILKSGEKIRFYWFGGYKEFTVPELKDTKVCSVKLYIGQWGARDTGNQFVTRNYFRGISIRIDNVEKWRDIPNKFAANQILTADCSNGDVTLQGLPRQDLGALGNDWEGFYLKPGTNQIECIASNWATQPEFTMKYREVFL